MSRVLTALGVLTIIGGIIRGIMMGLEVSWGVAVFWWIGGVISGIIFFTFATILDYLAGIQHALSYLIDIVARREQPEVSPSIKSNSKANLDSLKGYKIGASD